MSDPTWNGAEDLEPLLVPVTDLHEDPANPRAHPDENLDALTASLKEFGQDDPIIVREETRPPDQAGAGGSNPTPAHSPEEAA